MNIDWREFGETFCSFIEGAVVIAVIIIGFSLLYNGADYLIGGKH